MVDSPVQNQPVPVDPFQIFNSIDEAIQKAHENGAFNALPMSYTVELFGNIQMMSAILRAQFGNPPTPEDGEETPPEVKARPKRAKRGRAKPNVRKPAGGKGRKKR